jgi:uncharacterized protein YndB with AHSA1/START domain
MSDTVNAERGYTITRTFDAPRELVWKAWTEPEQFGEWFGGPDATMKDLTMDVRPEGRWSGTMMGPGHPDIDWRGIYLEVSPPERLVVAFSDQEILGDEYETFTVILTDAGGKTEMVLRQSGGHLTDEQYEEAKQGTSMFMDTLADVLARG